MQTETTLQESPRIVRWSVWLLSLVLVVVLCAAGWWLWRKYDPFVLDRRNNREAMALAGVAQDRTLTDGEFRVALQLADCGEPIAQLAVMSVFKLEAEREPMRRTEILAALAKCSTSDNMNVAQAATTTAIRIRALPAGPTTPKRDATKTKDD